MLYIILFTLIHSLYDNFFLEINMYVFFNLFLAMMSQDLILGLNLNNFVEQEQLLDNNQPLTTLYLLWKPPKSALKFTQLPQLLWRIWRIQLIREFASEPPGLPLLIKGIIFLFYVVSRYLSLEGLNFLVFIILRYTSILSTFFSKTYFSF